MAKKRVMFSFDDRSLASLEELTESGNFPSMAETVRGALQVSRALQKQAEQGYTEVVVRDPETKEERVLVLPALHIAKNDG